MGDSGRAQTLHRRATLLLACAVCVLGATGAPAVAAGPVAELTPSDLEFSATIGASVSKTATLKNTGDGTFTATEVVTSGPPFTIVADMDKCTGKTLAAGQSCKIDVEFKPTASGAVNGNLSVTVTGADSPLPVSLVGTGTGSTPPPPPAPPPPPPPVVLPPPPPPPAPNDLDRDGVPDSTDACPLISGAGANGCPGGGTGDDEDGDGVTTSDDDCPTVAGNLSNGCPSKLNASIDGHWRVNSLYSQLVSLIVRATSGSRIELLCSSKRNPNACGFKKRVIKKTTKPVTALTRYFKGKRILPAGMSITVKVTRRLQVGTYERVVTRTGRKLPKVTEACLSAKTGAVGRCSS